MSTLEIVRTLHISCAAISIGGFVVRGIGMLLDARWLNNGLVKILPHVVDTLLLASACWLVALYGLALLSQDWLLAKIVALPLYVIAGVIALKRGKNKRQKVLALIVALSTAAYIVVTAVTKSPVGIFQLLN